MKLPRQKTLIILGIAAAVLWAWSKTTPAAGGDCGCS
jgi:hypothetical protein